MFSSPESNNKNTQQVSWEQRLLKNAGRQKANLKPEYQDAATINTGSFPCLLCAPYPVAGTGQIDVQIQSTSASEQRIQLVFGVLEVCSAI